MTWIESHQELREHPKAKRCARLLNVGVPQIVGHLQFLWWWAVDYAEDGDLSRFDAYDVADAAGWEGDAEAFVAALMDCGPSDSDGFLNRDWTIHDWDDYSPLKRRKHPTRQEWDRIRRRVKPLILSRDGKLCSYCGATETLEIDHIQPIASGGTNELDNLQVLCRSCNASKGAR